MTEWIPILLALTVTGAIAGLLAGLLGVGGGIVIVPVLFFIFQLLGISPATAMSVAAGTSLLTIIPTSISSIRSHHKRGNVDFSIVKRWGPMIVLGAIAGVFFAGYAGGEIASIIFACIAIVFALHMLFRAQSKPLFIQLPAKIWQAIIASVIGLISVIMGIGGGTLGVPTLTAYNTPTHRAVGTAAVFGLLIALPGATLMLLLGDKPADAPVGTYGLVNLIGFAVIVPLTVAMAPVGVRLGSVVNGVLLKRIFAVFLCASGVRMILQALG